jgi:hypothetical protein
MSRGNTGKWTCHTCKIRQPQDQWDWYLKTYKAKHGKDCPFKPYTQPCKTCRIHLEEMYEVWPKNLETTAWKLYQNEEFKFELNRILKLVDPNMGIGNEDNGEILLNKHRKRRGIE